MAVAAKTFIWLGPSTPSTCLAVDLITRVGTIATKMADDIWHWDTESYSRSALESYETCTEEQSEQLGIPFSDVASWDALSAFYDNAWFQRIWIVQEALPARNATMLCGAYSVPWLLAKNAAAWYHYKAGDAVFPHHKRTVDGVANATDMSLTWNIRQGSEYLAPLLGQKTHPTYKWALYRLLQTFRNRLATDPRDKVYALVGLSELDGKIGSDDEPFVIDYAKDVRTVFAETARAIIRNNSFQEGNIDIILDARRSTCRCSGESPLEADWPSWVPDWRVHAGEGCRWGVGRRIPAWHGHRSQVGKHKEPVAPRDLFALETRGIVLGRATYVSPHRHASEIILKAAMRAERDKCLEMVDIYPTGEPVEVAFALTMIGGTLPACFVEMGVTPRVYADKYLGWLDSILMPQSTREELEAKSRAGSRYLKYGFNNDWVEHVIKAYCERRWYVLDTNYIGLGNHYMREGDVVARLVGLSVPCVLRPKGTNTEDGYEFIGCVGMALEILDIVC